MAATTGMDIQTPDGILSLGLELVGFNKSRQRVRRKKNLERFSSHFGSQPVVYSQIYNDMQCFLLDGEPIFDVKRDKRGAKEFMMAICFLKMYPNDNQAEGRFGLSDRTIRDIVWFFLEKITLLKAFKIKFPRRFNANEDDGEETVFILSVDGVHCRILEPMHGEYSKNPEFYSHKFKQAALDYEIAISIFTQQVLFINGPFPAGKNDISVFKSENGLAAIMRTWLGKLGIADLGYRGSDGLLTTPNSHDSPEVRAFNSQVLARHESFNGRMKRFACLSGTFRHGKNPKDRFRKHKFCFESVAIIGQCQLENGAPLNPV